MQRNALITGLKHLIAGAAVRHMSAADAETPLMLGGAPNVIGHGMLAGFLVIVAIDYLSGPNGKWLPGMHSAAVHFLNKAEAFKTAAQPDRAAIFSSSIAKAAGETALLHYALLALVPPLGALQDYLPISWGYVWSVPIYAWYAGGDDGEMRSVAAVAGTLYAIAGQNGGALAAGIANAVARIGVCSLYFHALLREKKTAKQAAASSGGEKKSGGAASTGSSKKKNKHA